MLHDLQALPLEEKIEMSKDRIQEWYEHWDGQVYVSFSGGKDSTVLLHLVRSMYPNIKAMYCDTGLENPDVRQFVMKHENTESVRPNMTFKEVLTEYGYPIVSKEVAEAIHYARGGLRQGKKKLSWRRAQLYGIPDKPIGGVSREKLRRANQLLGGKLRTANDWNSGGVPSGSSGRSRGVSYENPAGIRGGV